MARQTGRTSEEIRRLPEGIRRADQNWRPEAYRRGQENASEADRSGSRQSAGICRTTCQGSRQSRSETRSRHLASSEAGPRLSRLALVGRNQTDGLESCVALQREEPHLERRPGNDQAAGKDTRQPVAWKSQPGNRSILRALAKNQ